MAQERDSFDSTRIAHDGPEPSGAELRGAPRFTLLVRAAKLVVDGREYLCVLRDASATGCKVRLFHEIPPGRNVALETASGERFAMELMWYRDDHAGFRFFDEVDVHRLIEDRRGQYPKRQIRLRTEYEVNLIAHGQSLQVVLHDISQQGACIESAERLMLRQPVKMEVPGFPPIFAKVCWRQQPRHGLVFDTVFTMEELACNMLRLHGQAEPLGPTIGTGGLRAAS
ncbi:MAG TPA: PilZ domain-containing protein [Novosphingobium sp.]|nr:PilZ domain-containing protein [Novosphingobium sp.]